MDYEIRDLTLAESGRRKIEWAAVHMPVLNEIRREYEKAQPLKGQRVALSIHLEAKTAYLAIVLRALGAEVAVTGSNPLSTQDDVAAALVAEGMRVYAWRGATEEEYFRHLKKTLAIVPTVVIDDGGDLVHLLHTELTHLQKGVLGGCEETTTGVMRLKAREKDGSLAFPMIAVNDARCKHLFDNRYGTGESVWAAILRTTNLVTAGKTVVVAGYGWCGKGVAMRAKGLGARVIVTEVDPVKAIEAWMDGFEVMPMDKAAPLGDIFITVTGCKDVIRGRHYRMMKDGAILANAGHFDVEINKPELRAEAVEVRVVRDNIEEFRLKDGRRLYLLAEGRLVNLAAGDGHPVEIMDMSFALQAMSALYLVQQGTGLEKKVYPVPEEIDRKVAWLKLKSLGTDIDRLTPEQEEYLSGWQHG
ncbi:MAG: adenosylhomocysteinase [Eubacteriales bacterium]|nr:adenosylhomocysteinase [Eubacteriales bacterium]